jgi:hypothetical protein
MDPEDMDWHEVLEDGFMVISQDYILVPNFSPAFFSRASKSPAR